VPVRSATPYKAHPAGSAEDPGALPGRQRVDHMLGADCGLRYVESRDGMKAGTRNHPEESMIGELVKRHLPSKVVTHRVPDPAGDRDCLRDGRRIRRKGGNDSRQVCVSYGSVLRYPERNMEMLKGCAQSARWWRRGGIGLEKAFEEEAAFEQVDEEGLDGAGCWPQIEQRIPVVPLEDEGDEGSRERSPPVITPPDSQV